MNLTQWRRVIKRSTGRVKRSVKKIKKTSIFRQATMFAITAPLLIPVGVVTAANVSTPAVQTPDNEFQTGLVFNGSETVVSTPVPQFTVEVTESEYQKQQKAKIAAIKSKTRVAVTRPVTNYSAAELMRLAGIPESQWGFVDFIINHEAGWNGTTKYNYQGSGAYGICQAKPGVKMASAGSDWSTNSLTQLKWCDSYAKSRHNGWEGAYQFWITHRYW